MTATLRVLPALIALGIIGNTVSHAGPDYGKAPAGKAYGFSDAIDASYVLPWSTRIIYGFDTGSSDREARFDILYPLFNHDDTMYFLYPRVSWPNHTDGGASLGFGARKYLPNIDALVGANIFYDNYESIYGNRFSQLGLGAEVLTENFDFRFNYYFPEGGAEVARSAAVSTPFVMNRTSFGTPFAQQNSIFQRQTVRSRSGTLNQVFQSNEQAMDGLDTEVGVKIPYFDSLDIGELRTYGGYFWFDNPYGANLDGVKARAEWKLTHKLALETAWFEEEALVGDNWTFGFRVNLPIEDGPNGMRNTFAGIFKDPEEKSSRRRVYGGLGSQVYAAGGSSVMDRITEEINRDNRVHTSESSVAEDVSQRGIVLGEATVKTAIDEVHDNVVFVKGGVTPRISVLTLDPTAGTAENPVDTIQDGVDVAAEKFGNAGQVIVNGDLALYFEDVEDAGSSVKIWGGALGIPVNGGKRFTYGSAMPFVDGGFEFEDVNSVRVSGFRIVGGNGGGYGVATWDVKNVVVSDNVISNVDTAVNLGFDTDTNMNFIVDNNFLSGMRVGVSLDLSDVDAEQAVTGVISNNEISDSDEGFEVDLEDYDANVNLEFFGNSFVNNAYGIDLDASDIDEMNQTLVANIHDNLFMNNYTAVEADYADADNDGTFEVDAEINVIGNTFMSNGYDFYMDFGSDSSGDDTAYNFTVNIRNNEFSDTDSESVTIEISDDYDGDGIDVSWDIDIVGNSFTDIGSDAIRIDLTEAYYRSLNFDARIQNNTINGAGGDGVHLDISDMGADDFANATAVITGNTILNVSDDGIDVLFGGLDSSSLVIGNNIISGASVGIEIDGSDGTTLDDGVFGNNLVSDTADSEFDIDDVDGTIRINGVEQP